jgi:hypothetical protein
MLKENENEKLELFLDGSCVITVNDNKDGEGDGDGYEDEEERDIGDTDEYDVLQEENDDDRSSWSSFHKERFRKQQKRITTVRIQMSPNAHQIEITKSTSSGLDRHKRNSIRAQGELTEKEKPCKFKMLTCCTTLEWLQAVSKLLRFRNRHLPLLQRHQQHYNLISIQPYIPERLLVSRGPGPEGALLNKLQCGSSSDSEPMDFVKV